MTEAWTPLPKYTDSAEIKRRADAVAQSPVTVDKPAVVQKKAPLRFRHMKVKSRRSKRWNPKRPQFY